MTPVMLRQPRTIRNRTMNNPAPQHRFIRVVWPAAVTLLAVTGIAQMPVFKRYYIADIPGLAWTADPMTTHLLHYLGAVVLLAAGGWMTAVFLLQQRSRWQLTTAGVWRLGLLLGLAATGYLRVVKNLPEFYWPPVTTMIIDWSHLGLAALLGLASLAFRMTGHGAWLAPRR